MSKEKYLEVKVDEFNRIVIPEDFREKVGCEANENIYIKQIGNEMVLSFEKKCMFCGNTKDALIEFKSKTICMPCINAISNNKLFETVTSNEFQRKVDHFFRIVLPKEICQNIKIHPDDIVYMYIKDKKIFVKSSASFCAICGDNVSLKLVADIHICKDCITSLSELATQN